MGSSGRSSVYGEVAVLSPDQELQIADTIENDFRSQGSPKEYTPSREAKKAIDELIKSYSLLIEAMAREAHANSGGYGVGLEDFIDEAYLVAVQCARTFRPRKGKSIIRFSSYVSRAISSSLMRMAMRSRSSASVPTSVMADARRWAKAKFDLANKGVEVDDATVSAISGVNSTQGDVRGVLKFSEDSCIEEEYEHPAVEDNYHLEDTQRNYELVRYVIQEWFGDDSRYAIIALGVDSGTPLLTLAKFAEASGLSRKDSKIFLDRLKATIGHPLFRAFAKDISSPG